MSKDTRQIAHAWLLILQVGLTVLTAVALCLMLGLFLDRQFGWYTTVPLLILGMISGCTSAYRMIRAAIGKNDSDDLAGIYERLEKERRQEQSAAKKKQR